MSMMTPERIAAMAPIDLSLDQTRQLVIDLTNAYSACRPALLDQKRVDRITSFFGMR